MVYIFKQFKLKHWLEVFFIAVLTVAQVYFTMTLVSSTGYITAAMQNLNSEVAEVANAAKSEMLEAGFVMIICALFIGVVYSGIIVLASHVSASIVTDVRSKLYARVNKFAISDLNEFSTESLITRTTNDIQNIHLALLTVLKSIFLAPVTIIWSIIILITQVKNNPLIITTAAWIALLIIVITILVILLLPKMSRIQTLTDDLNTAGRENLTGVRVVRAFNAETYQEAKFTNVNTKYAKINIFVGRAIALFSPVVIFVMMGLSVSILWITSIIINGQTQAMAKDIFAGANSFIMLTSQIVMSFVVLVSVVVVWPRAVVSGRRVKQVLTHNEAILDPENPIEFTEEGTIEFRNVSYKYPFGDKNAVSNISFKVNKGETIAFIGATGSGKTTIINMIPRMADATEGEVLVDGVNVKNVLQNELRKKIGYAPQRGFLFSGNIKENVAFSNPELTNIDIENAAKIAEAHTFVSEKRAQYDSEVAQGGTNFSGGQKQRLCIARAVANKPEILIFDDSFSALDYKTDRKVRTNIKEQLPGTTRVIIAQRVGTIMDADQIVVLDEGVVVGLGKHEDLVRNCSVYQEIALSQLSKEELGLTSNDVKGGN